MSSYALPTAVELSPVAANDIILIASGDLRQSDVLAHPGQDGSRRRSSV